MPLPCLMRAALTPTPACCSRPCLARRPRQPPLRMPRCAALRCAALCCVVLHCAALPVLCCLCCAACVRCLLSTSPHRARVLPLPSQAASSAQPLGSAGPPTACSPYPIPTSPLQAFANISSCSTSLNALRPPAHPKLPNTPHPPCRPLPRSAPAPRPRAPAPAPPRVRWLQPLGARRLGAERVPALPTGFRRAWLLHFSSARSASLHAAAATPHTPAVQASSPPSRRRAAASRAGCRACLRAAAPPPTCAPAPALWCARLGGLPLLPRQAAGLVRLGSVCRCGACRPQHHPAPASPPPVARRSASAAAGRPSAACVPGAATRTASTERCGEGLKGG